MSLASVNLAPKAAILCEIMRNNGHWAIQSHSGSSILLPMLLVNKSAESNLGRGPRRGTVGHICRKVPICYNGAP